MSSEISNNLHTIHELQKIKISEVILLRPLAVSDADAILKILETDPDIRNRVTVASTLFTPEDVIQVIKKYQEDPGMIRYTILKDDYPIGLVSLWRDDGFFDNQPKLHDYGFGYFLDPKERGKGLMTFIVRTLMKTVEENIQVQQFVAFCEDDNTASISILEKIGFQPTNETFSEPKNGWVERKYVRAKDD